MGQTIPSTHELILTGLLPRQFSLADACYQWPQYDEGAEPAESGLRGAANVWSYSSQLKAALLAEFFGMMIFQIYGGNAPDSVAAFGNGITLVVLGGHPYACLRHPIQF